MLTIKNLSVEFQVEGRMLQALDDVSFDVPDNRMVGLVGESGSGKSITTLSVMKLLPANGRISNGSILWNGRNLIELSENQLREVRGQQIGLIFQNPQSCLNPVFTIGNQLMETIKLHHATLSKTQVKEMAISLLKKVNIPDPEQRLNQYPHQFSMGMCQRLMIALTIAMQPQLLIADEPTASLDVTIQAQILDLLEQLKQNLAMSILLISHDLSLIAQHCDDVVIMYLGKIIETGTTLSFFKNPLHPYTQALLSAIPVPDPSHPKKPAPLQSEPSSIMHIPCGCRFHPRCPKAFNRCKTEVPQLNQIPGQSQRVACFLYEKNAKTTSTESV